MTCLATLHQALNGGTQQQQHEQKQQRRLRRHGSSLRQLSSSSRIPRCSAGIRKDSVEPVVEEHTVTFVAGLLTQALNGLSEEETSRVKGIVARMVRLGHTEAVDAKVLTKLITVLDVQIVDVAYPATMAEDGVSEEAIVQAEKDVKEFIRNLAKQKFYRSALFLSKHFSLRFFGTEAEDLLVAMVSDGQADLAGQWAEYLGRDHIVFLVEHCSLSGLHKAAYRLVKRYELHTEFPDAFHSYKRSSLRKLVNKGLWEVAESSARDDRVLQEYLIMLALGKKQEARAFELCELFQLQDFDISSVEITDTEEPPDYMRLEELEAENVVWVDDAQSLTTVPDSILKAGIVGIDSEWKANFVKGGKHNKVCVLQLATKKDVFILDLLWLSTEAPEGLNRCIRDIFSSATTLKLGFGLKTDLKLLASSYPDLEAFYSCENYIDLEIFPERRKSGGLSGLAKAFLGKPLDKNVRMSDWSRRPLSVEQLNYAALDAAVLIPIFERICVARSLPVSGQGYAHTWNYRTL